MNPFYRNWLCVCCCAKTSWVSLSCYQIVSPHNYCVFVYTYSKVRCWRIRTTFCTHNRSSAAVNFFLYVVTILFAGLAKLFFLSYRLLFLNVCACVHSFILFSTLTRRRHRKTCLVCFYWSHLYSSLHSDNCTAPRVHSSPWLSESPCSRVCVITNLIKVFFLHLVKPPRHTAIKDQNQESNNEQ